MKLIFKSKDCSRAKNGTLIQRGLDTLTAARDPGHIMQFRKVRAHCHDLSPESRRNNIADALADCLSDIEEVEENPVPHLMPSSLPIRMKAGLTDIDKAICRLARIKRPPDRDTEDIRQEEDVATRMKKRKPATLYTLLHHSTKTLLTALTLACLFTLHPVLISTLT